MLLKLIIFNFNYFIYIIITGFIIIDNLVWLILYTKLTTFAILEKNFKYKFFKYIKYTNNIYINLYFYI